MKSFILDTGELILVDTGLNFSGASTIKSTLEKNNYMLKDVKYIVLTHSHMDHIGGLKDLSKNGVFEVVSHNEDADAIQNSTGVKVDRRINDGEDIVPGVKVIYIPGHTRGNISLITNKVLIAGDTLRGVKDGISPPPSNFNANNMEDIKNLSRLLAYDFDYIALSHGKDFESGGKVAVEKLIAQISKS